MRSVAFVLFEKFSMIGLTSALEPIRVVNRFSEPEFTWRFVSVDGQAVAASNGIPVSAGEAITSMQRPDIAIFDRFRGRTTISTAKLLNIMPGNGP